MQRPPLLSNKVQVNSLNPEAVATALITGAGVFVYEGERDKL